MSTTTGPFMATGTTTTTSGMYSLDTNLIAQEAHFLAPVISEMLEDLSNDLLLIRYKLKCEYWTEEELLEQEVKEIKSKIFQRLCDHFYDVPEQDVKEIYHLVELKAWPPDWTQQDNLVINGRTFGVSYLILLRIPPKKSVYVDVVTKHGLRKRSKKKFGNADSKEATKYLSRIHSHQARRK